MSGSDISTGVVAGASTTAAGAAVLSTSTHNGWLSPLAWLAIILGSLVVASFIILFFVKRRKKAEE